MREVCFNLIHYRLHNSGNFYVHLQVRCRHHLHFYKEMFLLKKHLSLAFTHDSIPDQIFELLGDFDFQNENIITPLKSAHASCRASLECWEDLMVAFFMSSILLIGQNFFLKK